MNLLRGLSAVPLLWRLLKTLVGIHQELGKIRETLELRLKLDLVQADLRLADLRAAEEELGGVEVPMEVLSQSDADFAELERMEKARGAAGGRVSIEDDLEALIKDEEDDGR